MRIGIISNEYPPNVYGGAGVHVEYLADALARIDERAHRVNVWCFGEQELEADNLHVCGMGHEEEIYVSDKRHHKLIDTLLRDIKISAAVSAVDILHGHTWYSHFAGIIAQKLHEVPLVLTTHSLEPHRPWKVDQLGSAYNVSSWIERTAYQTADGVIAVSKAMRDDVHSLYDVPLDKIRVIHNGIDITQYARTTQKAVLEKYNIDTKQPYILFLGRITRQKGIIHLVNAIQYMSPGIQVVLCAGAPDTQEIGAEMETRVAEARQKSKNKIIWIADMVSKEEAIALYSQAALFVCPSIYEPFGIINLEAMACQTPVVASDVGGIPEVVIPGQTGVLVYLHGKQHANGEPKDPAAYSRDLAHAINNLIDSPDKRTRMAQASRERVESVFSWDSIAQKTLGFYESVLS